MRQDPEFWMKKALLLAKKAAKQDEVPVGAILVGDDGQLIAEAHNLKETLTTPIGHAEILCLHRAAKKNQAWRLTGSTLYVTLEPCVMCAGALIQARVKTVYFGTEDPKGGGLTSLYQIGNDKRLNHQIEVFHGILKDECSDILKKFFQQKREKAK